MICFMDPILQKIAGSQEERNVMDENFLLHKKRALRLLELMKEHDKAWALYVFTSANILKSYTMEQLIGLGISWVWMGLEGQDSEYAKLNGIDTFKLVEELQSHGIRVLGSTIIGLEEHTTENIEDIINYAVRHDIVFHQFMLYTPSAGTPLYEDMTARGLMKETGDYHLGDIHGQDIFNYFHPNIPPGKESEYVYSAFEKDFEVNGPSLARIVRTTLTGWKRYKNHPDPRVRRRFFLESRELPTIYAAVIGTMKKYYRKDQKIFKKMKSILNDLYREFGLKARLFSFLGRKYLMRKVKKEEKRLAAGWTYEPPTFYETNNGHYGPGAPVKCRFVVPKVRPEVTNQVSAHSVVI